MSPHQRLQDPGARFSLFVSKLLDRAMPVPVSLLCGVITWLSEDRLAVGGLSVAFIVGNIATNLWVASRAGVSPGTHAVTRASLGLLLLPPIVFAGVPDWGWVVVVPSLMVLPFFFSRAAWWPGLLLSMASTGAAILGGYSTTGLLVAGAVMAGVTIVSSFVIGSLRDQFIRQEVATAEADAATQDAHSAGEARARFLANMSHEIRTPLNGVMGVASALARTELNKVQRNYVQTIEQSGTALLTIINDVLDYSKIEAGKLEVVHQAFSPIAVVDHAKRVFEKQAGEKGLRLAVSVDVGEDNRYLGDPIRIGQILLNLVGNAVKFTEHGEVLVHCSFLERAGALRFEVQDTGVGIDSSKLDFLFDRFTQLDQSSKRAATGTGLGLAISHQLCQLMGGRIGAEGKIGEGALFWFEVPAEVTSAPQAKPEVELAAPFDGRSRMALVVDDNQVNRMVADLVLSAEGFRVVTLGSGLEAIDAVAGSPDVVFMDCHMPEMDGFEATMRIREHEKSSGDRTTIIALTADALRETKGRCLEAGMDDVLVKPIDTRELRAVLRRRLS